ncbi:MAG: tetratricopeptide repeat protein [Acidobacteria bacterium]|nr:tetratricopeptide repeat protein [Acidobacteriota bacterium]
MKIAFLKSKVSIIIIGLVLGMAVGFKIANSQYRREQGALLSSAVAQASGQITGSESADSSGGRNLTPEQRNQIINEVKSIVDKARNNPQDIEAQFDAAAQFIQISRPEEALKFLEQAKKVKPDDARTMAGFGVAYLMMGRASDAVKSAKRARELDPNNPNFSILLFSAYLESKQDLAEAERLLKGLESSGLDPKRLSEMRADLNATRSAGVNQNSKTMLDHGPDETKPLRGGDKTGGKR